MELIQILKEERKRQGLTQADIAEKAGVGQSSISAFEAGTRQSVRNLSAYMCALGLDLKSAVAKQIDSKLP